MMCDKKQIEEFLYKLLDCVPVDQTPQDMVLDDLEYRILSDLDPIRMPNGTLLIFSDGRAVITVWSRYQWSVKEEAEILAKSS